MRNVLLNNPRITEAMLERTKQLINENVPDCLIEGYEPLIKGLTLPDMNDRHVVAAALKGHAEAIITFNLKDFPESELNILELSAIHPDEFLCDMFELDPSSCIKAAQQQRSSLKNPAMTVSEFLNCLQKQKLPVFVSKLRPFELML